MTMQTPAPAGFRQARAFTLVEVMLASTISLLVVLAVSVYFIFSLKAYYSDFNRLNVNNDLRRFTQSMETDAAFANTFYIYDTATNGAIPTSGTDNFVTPGESGDLVLLVSIHTANTGATTVNQIVAYYHNGAVASTGPIYRYATVVAYPNGIGAAGTTPIYTLYHTYIETPLHNIITAGQQFMPTATVVGTAQNSAGSPAAVHPNLFYYLWRPGTGNGAFMIQSKIQEQQNNQTVLAIDTYNFTIWPRS